MKIFEPYEVEIKTGRSRDELIERFKKKARIEGDKFYIKSGPYGLSTTTTVVGEISETTTKLLDHQYITVD